MKSCPQTVSQWKEAAVRKGCDKFTHPCSSFEYHYVINVWINETIEVCAPRQLIVGKNTNILQSFFKHIRPKYKIFLHLSCCTF